MMVTGVGAAAPNKSQPPVTVYAKQIQQRKFLAEFAFFSYKQGRERGISVKYGVEYKYAFSPSSV